MSNNNLKLIVDKKIKGIARGVKPIINKNNGNVFDRKGKIHPIVKLMGRR